MGMIEDARTLIGKFRLPKELTGDKRWPVTARELAEEFTYQVGLEGDAIGDEEAVPLGSSKLRGLPHLPEGMEWPEGFYFQAQINLEELARVDRSGWLPGNGMLYFFFNGEVPRVIHWKGSIDELQLREYPDAAMLPNADYYLSQFKRGTLIKFKPYGLFRSLSDYDAYDFRELHQRLPQELITAVSEKIGAPIEQWDEHDRLYGKTIRWQDEDDFMDFDPDLEDPSDDGGQLLLLQCEFGDATIHFVCGSAAAAAGDFSGVEVTSSTS